MKTLLAALAITLGMFGPALAQTTISGLPPASSLGGSELVPVVQAGITSKATVSQFAALTVAVPNTWALGQVFSAGTTSTAPILLHGGVVLTSPLAGAFEWDGSNLSVTQTSGPTRKRISYADFSNVTGTLGISNGGTGGTTAAGALAALGAAPLAGSTFTGEVVTASPTTSLAGLNLPHGATPTSPVNGDLWTTTAGVYARISGLTVGPLVGNGWTLISTQTASGSAALTWSSLPTNYVDLKIIVNATVCVSSTHQSLSLTDSNAATVTGQAQNETADASANYGVLNLLSWQDHAFFVNAAWASFTRPHGVDGTVGGFNTAGTLTSISLVCNTGNIASGSASLYGR